MTNWQAWIEKIKALPTSIRFKALMLYAAYLVWGIPEVSERILDSMPKGPEALQIQAAAHIDAWLILGPAIAVSAFIIGESVRAIVLPCERKKQNEVE